MNAARCAISPALPVLLLLVSAVPARSQIETVVVTAERRSESLQRIPVAVTAFTSKTRDRIGISTIQDMANFAPGMTYSTSTDRVTIRGVSRQTNVLSADAGVANYDDGIYQSFAVTAGRSSLDLARVEVVRGPQSTLYGRNSIGGAINQITARPSDEFGAEFRADYGSYEHSNLEGAITGPLSDNWQYRVYGDWEHQGLGWIKNTVPGMPEEGNVINTWYAEAQLTGKIGNNLESYSRFYATVWSNRGGGAGAQSNGWTPADYPTFETGQGTLTQNPGYGCTVDPPSGGPASNPGYPNASGDTTVLTSASPIANPCHNPQVGSPWKQATLTPVVVSVPGAYFGTTQWTYHTGADFDVKYSVGAEWYRYVLTGPNLYSGNLPAPVSSVTISTTAPQVIPFADVPGLSSFGACFDALSNPGGTCPPLTFNPQQYFNYEEQAFFTQNELNLQSTGSGPFQWMTGLYWFQQHISQPVSASEVNGFGLATPFGTPPEGPFTTPHAHNPYRWFDDRVYFNNTSLAAYAQSSYQFSDAFKATLGVRYSNDRKYGIEQTRLVDWPVAPEFFGATDNAFSLDVTPPGSIAPAPDAVDYFSGNSGPCFNTTGPGPTGVGGSEQSVPPTPDTGVPQCGQYNAATGFAHRRYDHASNAFTGNIDFDYTPDEATLVYAKYGRGYKGGGFNTGIFSFINPKPWVGPEHLDAFEVGTKKTFGEGWLVLDAAAYYYNYQDMQVPLGVAALPGGVNSTEFLSIPRAISQGFEVESTLTPAEHLTFTASYSLNDSHISSSLVNGLNGAKVGVSDPADPNALVPGAEPLYTPAQCDGSATAGMPLCGTDIYTVNPIVPNTHPAPEAAGYATDCNDGKPCGWVIPQSLKGQRLPNAPRNKIALNLVYDWIIPDIGTFTPSVSYIWRSVQYGTVFTRFYNLAPSWDQWNARLGFSSPDSHWQFYIYGNNLLNKIGYDTGAIGSRYAGTIARNCDGGALIGGGVFNPLAASVTPNPIDPALLPIVTPAAPAYGTAGYQYQPCNFVQGEAAGAGTNTPPGYGRVRGESAYGTVSTYSVTPPTTYGAQLQYKF